MSRVSEREVPIFFRKKGVEEKRKRMEKEMGKKS